MTAAADVIGMHVCGYQRQKQGIKDKNRERFPTGPTTFGIQGHVHHYIGLTEPAPGDKPGFLPHSQPARGPAGQ